MTHPDAEKELRSFVRRWAARYANDPNRELALSTLLRAMPPAVREEASTSEAGKPTPADGSLVAQHHSQPPFEPQAAPVVSSVETSTPSGAFLWTGAGVAVALLVGLVVFWKRRV